MCWPEASEQAAWAKYEAMHRDRPWHDGTRTSWSEKQDADHPFRYDHGTTIWVAREDHGHGGDFLTSRPARTGDDGVTEGEGAPDGDSL